MEIDMKKIENRGVDKEIFDLKLEEKNILFDSLTNNLSNGIVLIKNNLISYLNAAMYKLTGYQPVELYGKHYEILFDEEDVRNLRHFFSELQVRESLKIEVDLKKKDSGKTICILNAVFLDSSDPSTGIVCTLSDITDRKQAEETLRQSEEFHSTLLNAVSESLIGVDSNLKIVLFNTASKILFKRSTIECIGQPHEMLFTGIHKEIIKRYIQGYFDSNFMDNYNPGVFEVECINSAGEMFPAEISISPANFRGNSLVLLSIRDITRRKRYETALKQKQQEQEALLNNIPDLVFFKNGDLDYVLANKAFCNFVEMDEKEVIGKRDGDFFTVDGVFLYSGLSNDVFNFKKSISTEGVLTSKDNKTIYAITTVTPIFNDENNIIGLVGISRDITERREKEIELQKFTRELEETKKSLERKTFELIKVNQDLLLSRGELEKYSAQLSDQNKILRESEMRLKNLNMQKDKFVSIISHDLRNPFASLLGHAELLQLLWKETPEDKKLNYIGAIYNAAKHQLNQLNNLLEWAKFSDGRMPFKPRLINISDIIKKSQESLSGIKQKKNIGFINNVDERINILGDKNLLYRLFENLIGNALKFTPQDGSIWINTNYVEDHNQVFISLRDNGIGIPEEILPSLFKLEGKVSRTGTSGEPGTGLGLILCKEIVELHQGIITASSKPGEGSTFTLNLALASKDVLILSDNEERFNALEFCIKSLNRNYVTQNITDISQVQQHSFKRYPCFLIIDLLEPDNIKLTEAEIKSNNLIKIMPMLLIKEQEDDIDKKLPANNIIHTFFRPVENESIIYTLENILFL
jgi:PAS domain S-box-containing protein